MRTRWVALALGLGLSLAGCAEEPPPGTDAHGGADASAPDRSEKDAFETTLQRVIMLEEAGQYAEALNLCRQMERTHAGKPEAAQLVETRARLMNEQRDSLALAYAITLLGADRLEDVKTGRQKLREGGEVAAVLLRRVVREQSDRTAVEAARILADRKDRLAASIFARRLADRPPAPLARVLVDGLKAVTGTTLNALVCRDLFACLAKDTQFDATPVAEYLAWVLHEPCGGDGVRFDALLQEPGATKRLKTYVTAAAEAGKMAVDGAGGAKALAKPSSIPGIRGQYFAGTNFDKPVFERLDRQIAIPNEGQYKYPDGRKDDLSIRWTGFVTVPKDGQYTFYVMSDDGQRLWIDDKVVTDDWTVHSGTEAWGKVRLAAGRHAIRVEHFNGSSIGLIIVMWEGPGFGKQVLTDQALSTAPWPGMKKG